MRANPQARETIHRVADARKLMNAADRTSSSEAGTS
jgi:hypothetical protein